MSINIFIKHNNNSPSQKGWPPKADGVVPKWHNLPLNPKLKQRAKALRKAGVLSEVLLWNQLKKRQFLNLDFDRQKIIGNYIVDFFVKEIGTVIEVDGESHNAKQDKDEQRDNYLKSLDLNVIRVLDIDVKKNLQGVMDFLEQELVKGMGYRGQHTPPLRGTPLKRGMDALAQVYHYDLYGKRQNKYDFLLERSLKSIPFTKLPNKAPMYFMVPKDFELEEHYQKGFAISELFSLYSVGIVTARDNFTIHQTSEKVEQTINEFLTLDDEQARSKFKLGKDTRDWQINFARKDLVNRYPDIGEFAKLNYRPFDIRWTFYTGISKGFHCYPRNEVMQYFLIGENIGLSLCKQFKTGNQYAHAFISNNIIESSYVSNRTSEITSTFPLYLYPEENTLNNTRTPNLDLNIVKKIEEKLGLTFVHEKQQFPSLEGCPEGAGCSSFAPIDLLDYIYAVLHSPTYREKYKEFLKIDFPRVPYPKSKDVFWQLVALGGEIRKIHLLEDRRLDERIIAVEGEGNDKITNKLNKNDWMVKDGKVRLKINEDITLINIPLVAWTFYIGGYQPAQKWLKDRVGNSLSTQDFKHYNRIINALVHTNELMQKINQTTIS